MDAQTSLKKDWVLTREAFDKLLACLDPDRDRAAEKYEAIRESLIIFFEHRRSYSPEDLADETINRVARKLDEGQQIYTGNPASYFYGVARNLIKEQWQATAQPSPKDGSLSPGKEISVGSDDSKQDEVKRQEIELRLECLERCLGKLPKRTQELVIRYYQGESGAKINNRNQLARELGISRNALNNRVLRIRVKMEDCVQDCLKKISS
jgi:RNA polymerase sigma factor (sigma-70 family)